MNTQTKAASPRIDATSLQQQAQDFYAASMVWLQEHWLTILIAIGAGVVIFIGLHFLKSLGGKLCKRDQTGNGWYTVLGRAISKTNSFFIALVAAKLVSGMAHAPAEVAQTIDFLFTIAAVFQAAIWARELILGAIEHRAHSEHYSGEALMSAMGLIRVLVSFALFAVALIVVLDNLHVNVTGLVAGLGVGGIAIGLAAQGIFADLFAALAIIFDRPFRRGDAITYDQSSGTVESIGLKSTRIRGPNGELRVISNKNLLDKEIQNNTQREYRRVKFKLGIVCWTPVETMECLPGMLREIVEAEDVHFVRAGFVNFGDSSYDFELEFDSPGSGFQDAYDARHVIAINIIRRFNEHGIELAYPTQTAFTAAPQGGLIMPYHDETAEPSPVPTPPERKPGQQGAESNNTGSAVDEDSAGGKAAPQS
jgi:small-conductance mechanosensitive channel